MRKRSSKPAADPNQAAFEAVALRAIDASRLDTTCSPCEDFFRYANGGWLERTTIPPQYTIFGVGREIQDRNEALLRRIVEEAAGNVGTTTDPDAARVGRFYGSCIDACTGAGTLSATLQRTKATQAVTVANNAKRGEHGEAQYGK